MTVEQMRVIEEAIELVEKAQALVDKVLEDTDISVHYIAYGRYGFVQLLGNGDDYGCLVC